MLARILLSTLLVLLIAELAVAAPLKTTSLVTTTATSSSSSCPSLHVIVVRGSTEDGMGILQPVAAGILAQIAGSTNASVDYPATLTDYAASKRDGVDALYAQLVAQVKKCPDGKIALLGYSQGAQVVGDVISGAATGLGALDVVDALLAKHRTLSRSVLASIVAVVQIGDPTFVPGKSYDAGTSKQGGLFRRLNTAALDAMSSKIRSWCDTNDLFCASGFSVETHEAYVTNYEAELINFVVQKAA